MVLWWGGEGAVLVSVVCESMNDEVVLLLRSKRVVT